MTRESFSVADIFLAKVIVREIIQSATSQAEAAIIGGEELEHYGFRIRGVTNQAETTTRNELRGQGLSLEYVTWQRRRLGIAPATNTAATELGN